MGDIVLLPILGGIVLMNSVATVLVARDEYGETHQRVCQAVLIWLVPILGALLVTGMHRRPEVHSGMYRDDARGGDHFGTQHPFAPSFSDLVDSD